MADGTPPTFGTLVRLFRKRLRITQEQLADRAGLSDLSISSIELEANLCPQQRTVIAVANGLELSPEDRDLLLAAIPRRILGARLSRRLTFREIEPSPDSPAP